MQSYTSDMKKAFGYLFCLCCFLNAQNVHSQPEYPPKYTQDTVIYYGNGVLSKNEEARDAANALKYRLQDHLERSGRIDNTMFTVAYNPTSKLPAAGGLIIDLIEALFQITQLNFSQIWALLAGSEGASEDERVLLLQILAHGFPDLGDEITLATNPTVRKHIEMYNKALKECKRVVVVAHSQGNLFANMAYRGIEPTLQRAFGIVAVASPYGSVADSGPLTTIKEDKVIKFLPGAAPAIFNNYPTDDYEPWLGHYFVKSYLDPSGQAENKIIFDILRVMDRLHVNDNTDYCGWPATYASDYSLVREPYDKHLDSLGNYWKSAIWDKVWQAARNNTLEVQYRLGRFGDWSTLNLRNLRTDYNYYHAGEGQPDAYQLTPFVYIDNGPPLSTSRFSKIIEVNPKDVDTGNGVPFGVQQYRLVIDGKVIDQFTLDYDQPAWLNPKTSRPIIDPPIFGSNPIFAIPELP